MIAGGEGAVDYLRCLYLGTGAYARQVLENLAGKGFAPLAVVTGPDKPSGRGLRLHHTPVAELAADLGLDLWKPEKPETHFLRGLVERYRPDFALVCDYGKMVPEEVLSLLPKRFLNIHPSLLPRYRGAAPIQRALMDGVEKTGVSLMVMDEGMDSGSVVAARETEVLPDDDAGTLQHRLARIGADLLLESAGDYLEGRLQPWEQEPGEATYAPPLRKEELRIDWGMPAVDIHNRVRALAPSPGARARLEGKWMKLLRTRLREDAEGLLPGELAVSGSGEMLVGTGKGILEVLVLQPEGRRRMEATAFLRGYRRRGKMFFEEARGNGR